MHKKKKGVKIMMKHCWNASCLPPPLTIWQFAIHANWAYTWPVSKDNGGGAVINGAIPLFLQDVHDIDQTFPFAIFFSFANHLESNHKRCFGWLKPLQKRQKVTKKWKKCEFAISRINALSAKLNKTERSPLTLFS